MCTFRKLELLKCKADQATGKVIVGIGQCEVDNDGNYYNQETNNLKDLQVDALMTVVWRFQTDSNV